MGLTLYPKHRFQSMDVELRLNQQSLQLRILAFEHFKPLSEQSRAELTQQVQRLYQMFVRAVARYRSGLTEQAIRRTLMTVPAQPKTPDVKGGSMARMVRALVGAHHEVVHKNRVYRVKRAIDLNGVSRFTVLDVEELRDA